MYERRLINYFNLCVQRSDMMLLPLFFLILAACGGTTSAVSVSNGAFLPLYFQHRSHYYERRPRSRPHFSSYCLECRRRLSLSVVIDVVTGFCVIQNHNRFRRVESFGYIAPRHTLHVNLHVGHTSRCLIVVTDFPHLRAGSRFHTF